MAVEQETLTARIAPGGRRDVGAITWAFAQLAGRAVGTGPPNLFMTLGRHRRLFLGWLHFAGRLMPGGTLPRRESELIILRVARLRQCTYEFEHHVRLGRRAGVGESDLERVVVGPDADGWSDRERALLAAVDELIADRALSDGGWDALARHLDEKRMIEFLMLVGHYDMLATTLLALRVTPDQAR